MFTVVLPSAVAPATQYAGQAPQLAPGQIVEAVVLALLKEGAARIAIGELTLDVKSEVPLQPGSTLRLAVKGTEHAIKLVPIAGSLRPPAADMSTREAVGAREKPPLPASGFASAATHAPPVLSSPNRRPEPIVRIDLPQPPAYGGPASSAAPNGANAARPLAASAVSGELLSRPPTGAPTQTLPKGVESARAPVQIALAAGIRAAAAKQSGLAPLFSNFEALLARPKSAPEPLRQAAHDLLRLRLPADAPIASTDIRSALARSGLFLETQLANADRSAASGLAPDLKLVLLALRQALRSWLGAQTSASAMLIERQPTNFVANAREPEQTSLGAPPPYRGAPTIAQPAVAATVTDWPAQKTAEHLLTLTEGALARQTLLQAASLPERSDTHAEPTAPRWALEIPIVSPSGTSIAQFEISRDGRSEGASGQLSAWRVRFSIDVEPIGPVHVQIVLLGQRAAVTLWAERTGTVGEMRERAALLSAALQEIELEPDIHVRTGAPRPPPSAQAPGRFLDQAS